MKLLLVEQFFSGRHQVGGLDIERGSQLEDGADGGLILSSLNQEDEITLRLFDGAVYENLH